ncbi:MAG: hypothetical protein ACR2NS_06290, partial [Gemmatimonadaceae bacterium]
PGCDFGDDVRSVGAPHCPPSLRSVAGLLGRGLGRRLRPTPTDSHSELSKDDSRTSKLAPTRHLGNGGSAAALIARAVY